MKAARLLSLLAAAASICAGLVLPFAPQAAALAQSQTQPAEPTAPQPTLPAVELRIGNARVTAEIARTPEQLERGLMFRTAMADNAGMLFVLGPERRATFWMANTLLPLSVAYMDKNGRILEVHDMRPLDRSPVPSQSDKIAYALEMNQGWFELNRITPPVAVKPAEGTFGKAPLAP
ncbi:hypothetical protein SAMN05444156_2379 [Verrucomicrobium sp. GAS474]|uniref:DUF192 domain-containing protein n=1 Tax=Verrucomicrobium sp. GAS474 TaxID=1882831 RepID=UPI00087D2E9A|nr:DUF192 domain-containing protein [Verrucomicrobium sp. GAS474]SDU16922.1 hypothetical protein SAMN05444156_2379 [Verrucomicrobium sp. GAS474]